MVVKNLISFKHLFLLVPFIFLLGCEKEIELDLGDFQPHIVINTLFEGGSKWNVHVCKSNNVLDPQTVNTNLPRALVYITDVTLGHKYQLYHQRDGNFTNSGEIIQHGHKYRIDVSHPGYESVNAEAIVPLPIEVELLHSETLQFNGKLALKVDFEISDDPTADNYYIYEILNLIPNLPNDLSEVPFLDSPIKNWLSSVDGNTGYINDSSEKQSKLFITDQNFRGSVLNTSLVSFVEIQEGGSVNNPQLPTDVQYVPDFTQSRLKVIGASQEMYEYYKSVELMIQKEALNSSVSIPVKPYSNIENGLGIFAGFTEIVINIQQ